MNREIDRVGQCQNKLRKRAKRKKSRRDRHAYAPYIYIGTQEVSEAKFDYILLFF